MAASHRLYSLLLATWTLVPIARSTPLDRIQQNRFSNVTITTFESSNCRGEPTSIETYQVDTCFPSTTEEHPTTSYKYMCHNVVRPICAYFQYNCTSSGVETHGGREIEMPCDVCSVNSPFFRPVYYNYACDANAQTVTFDTDCDENCTGCNATTRYRQGACEPEGTSTIELIKVAPCAPRSLVLNFTNSTDCTGRFKITSETYSGGCDVTRDEIRVCAA